MSVLKRKKILFLSQVFPYPDDGGGKIKTLATLRALAKKYTVYAIFISEKKPSRADLNYLKKIGITKVKVFYNPRILDSVKDDLWHLAKSFFQGIPHYVFQYTWEPAKEFINQAVEEFQPDIIHIDHLNIAQYLPAQKKEVWILEHHNLEFYLLWTRFVHSQKWSRKVYLFIESFLTYWFERRTLPKFDHIFAISQVEAERAQRFFSLRSISAQPLIYPVSKVASAKKKNPGKSPQILFIGNLGWPPNEDAVEWFLQTMWPGIHQALPQVEFHVVGKNNPALSERLPQFPQVFFHGYQADLAPFLASATIFILPFRMGGGVRLKALTALSHGLPVVSTPLGIEGLDVADGQTVVLGKNPAKFTQQIIKVINSSPLQSKLRHQSLKYIEDHHGLNQNGIYLQKYLQITR